MSFDNNKVQKGENGLSFYSELKMCNDFEYPLRFDAFDASLKGTDCIIVKCQNVFDYFHDVKLPKDDGFGIDELVNIKLPFNEMFIEMECDKTKIGVYLAYDVKRSRNIGVSYIKFRGCKPFAAMLYTVSIDDYGKPTKWQSVLNNYYEMALQKIGVNEHELQEQELIGLSYFYVSLLTVQFMHCKNVEIKENDPNKELPSRVRKHLEKKGKPPLDKYYTLEIEPMKKILKTEGNIGHNGLKMALHICRGHFKDFSNGKGLFGKHKGLYWWDSQVRGSKEHGNVIKDYEIKLEKRDD